MILFHLQLAPTNSKVRGQYTVAAFRHALNSAVLIFCRGGARVNTNFHRNPGGGGGGLMNLWISQCVCAENLPLSCAMCQRQTLGKLCTASSPVIHRSRLRAAVFCICETSGWYSEALWHNGRGALERRDRWALKGLITALLLLLLRSREQECMTGCRNHKSWWSLASHGR